MPLRVSCSGPVLRLFSSGGCGPVPSSPCLAWGRSPPCGQACPWELALRAVGTRAPLAWLWGVQGWALSHTQQPILGACGRGSLPTGCGCGGCGRGDQLPTPQRALLRAGYARSGSGTGTPGGEGAPLAWVWSVRGLGALLRLAARPWGMRPGRATHWLWVRGLWALGPVTDPTARAPACWLCAL